MYSFLSSKCGFTLWVSPNPALCCDGMKSQFSLRSVVSALPQGKESLEAERARDDLWFLG